MTSPLSRIVSMTSARPVGDGPGEMPPPACVAVVMSSLLPVSRRGGPSVLAGPPRGRTRSPAVAARRSAARPRARPRRRTRPPAPSPRALSVRGSQQAFGHKVPPERVGPARRPPALGPPEVSGVLEQALRVVLQHEEDARQAGREFVEGHRAVDVALRSLGPPDDLVVRHLLLHRAFPRPVRPEDLSLPVKLLIS